MGPTEAILNDPVTLQSATGAPLNGEGNGGWRARQVLGRGLPPASRAHRASCSALPPLLTVPGGWGAARGVSSNQKTRRPASTCALRNTEGGCAQGGVRCQRLLLMAILMRQSRKACLEKFLCVGTCVCGARRWCAAKFTCPPVFLYSPSPR